MEQSPYTPGAGHVPRVLAGRDVLLRDWQLVVNDVVAGGRVRAQDMILVGPRGVGKTVTVSAFAERARNQGFEVVNLQAVSGHAGLVEALLQRARTRLTEEAGSWQRARKAFERIGGVNLSVAGIGGGVSTHQPDRAPGLDAGTLADALATLAEEVRKDTHGGGLLVTVDELQVASAPDLALLAATLHRLNVDHPPAAVLFAGTGLPFTPAVLRKAGVTHPDRLFVLEPIPLTLEHGDARYAVVEPALQAGIVWAPEAANTVVEASNGYPAHLQLFADATWTAAIGPDQITLADVEAALPRVASQLDRRTLGPRWDRISDRQMEFLAALALHGGRASTATIARTLGRTQQDLSWLRQELMEEGDIYAPKRGQLAMAVPLFNRYVLSHYERSRPDSATALLSLDQMIANAGLDTSALPTNGSADPLPKLPEPRQLPPT
ncbi:MAG TPA: ATP-binding protein [Candidatus Limnocylindrales bacterium]